MKQHRVWPTESWHFSIPVTASLGVRCGDTIHVGGQVALSTAGEVRHAGDLLTQTRLAMQEVARVLAAYGATPDDMVKLVAFYVDRGDDGRTTLTEIRRHFRRPFLPVITLIPVPYLAFDGMMVEIEGYAMRTPAGRWMPRAMAAPQGLWSWPPGARFPHAVRCGEMIHTGAQMAIDARGQVLHPGDIVAQSEIVMENLRRVLAAFGATLDDAVKFNIYYSGHGGEAEWRKAAIVRARYFREPGPAATHYTPPGPCSTGVPLPALAIERMVTEIEVVAMAG
jgi:enamine deaminase RidA (YjgF/YER057c/UK114 family)